MKTFVKMIWHDPERPRTMHFYVSRPAWSISVNVKGHFAYFVILSFWQTPETNPTLPLSGVRLSNFRQRARVLRR